MVKLGFNVDHVATLRQARRASYPDPLEAALAGIEAGADAVTVHLREDRRHILDHDLMRLREAVKVDLNQELAPTDAMVELALRVRPDEVCIVPERRLELTTEGGLDAAGLAPRLGPIISRFKAAGIGVSLFVAPEPAQIEAAARLGADFVELHSGAYANFADQDYAGAGGSRGPLRLGEGAAAELQKIRAAAKLARALKLKPNAGHGLNYHNVAPVAAIVGLHWLHVGHAIVARAVMVGVGRAVREMKSLIDAAAAPHAAARPGRRHR